MKQLVLVVIYSIILASCAPKQNLYIKDLDFIYNSILENHPGVYNKEDNAFNSHLERAYTVAKEQINLSFKNYSYKTAISDFAKSFNDPHMWVQWRDSAVQKKRTITSKIAISEPYNETVWVTLPSFDLTLQQEQEFKELTAKLLDAQKKKYIVFDLRGNQGGNSDYGSKIIDKLFSSKYADQQRCLQNRKVFVDWRVSYGNLNHISYLLSKYPDSDWLKNIENGLEKSIGKNNIFYSEYPFKFCKTHANKTFNFTVIVIIDSSNVSAALDFIDELKMMTPKVILIGQKTKADRLYMEVRSVILPSGIGNFFFPIKVYRNRMRLDNQAYVPNIEFQDIDNTQSLQNFISHKIGRGEI